MKNKTYSAYIGTTALTTVALSYAFRSTAAAASVEYLSMYPAAINWGQEV